MGRFFADEVAAPLDLDLYIGLPPSVDRGRIARLHSWKRAEALLHVNAMPPRLALALLNPFGLTGRSVNLPNDIDVMDAFDREEVRTVEIPAANGIGTARAVARAYGCAATGGSELGLTPATLAALANVAIAPTGGVRKAFGTPGLGGSFGFADPDTGIGFGYVMNRLGFHLYSDPRELALRQALFRDVLNARPQR